MAIYHHYDSKLPVGTPVYGFAYRIDDDGEVFTNCKPTLGKIEESAKYSYDGRFVPEDKSKRWCQYTILIYSDSYDEAVEAYNRMIEEHIKKLNETIRKTEVEIAEAKSKLIVNGKVDVDG